MFVPVLISMQDAEQDNGRDLPFVEHPDTIFYRDVQRFDLQERHLTYL